MLEHLKKDVYGIVRRTQRDGLCRHKSGDFSAYDAKSGCIVITPTSTDHEILTPRDMIVMDLDVSALEHAPGLQPASEALTHSMIYRTRKDTRAVVHIRSMYGTMLVLLNKPIPVIICEVANFGPIETCIPVVSYGHPGTMELADSVVEVCKGAEYFLLEKHDMVTFDTRDVYEAYLKANYIEEPVQLYYNVLAVYQGKEPEASSQEELQCWEYLKEISFADE